MATNIATLTPTKLEPYMNPQHARTLAGEFVASQTIAKGTVLGAVTASGKLKPYASGNSDGSQIPVGLCTYDIVVDASGNVVYGPSGSTVDLTRGAEKTAPYYWQGTFLVSDLTGFDATAVTNGKWRVVSGGATPTVVTIG